MALTQGYRSVLGAGYHLNAPGFPSGCATWMECYTNSPFMRFDNRRNQRFPDDERVGRVFGGQAAAWELRPTDYHRKVWTRLAAVGERLWSDPPEHTCEVSAVRSRLNKVMAHIRHEHNATATGPAALEKPEVIPPGYYKDMLDKVGPLPECTRAGGGGGGGGGLVHRHRHRRLLAKGAGRTRRRKY